MKLGLRIDVDTFRGTRDGVPNLLKLLASRQIRASFFFSVGPDNMGRHLLRLFRPSFLMKMIRSGAPGLYGWDILLKGTLWPGPVIGRRLAPVIRTASDAGHEIGLHAWDHHAWQVHVEEMDGPSIYDTLKKGADLIETITGTPPVCSAVPAWRCTDAALIEKEKFPFAYNSDCRGGSVFYPLVDGRALPQPQIPVTLPTYDEVIGRDGISPANYNEHILSLLRPGKLNVLTIHAEAEGIACLPLFEGFIEEAGRRDIMVCPLGELISDFPPREQAVVVQGEMKGRDGWISCQQENSGPLMA